jgi:hypothetical protein
MLLRIIKRFSREPVALLALFFALTGGAVAANNYIRSTDPITAGDLQGSTYGNPAIAAGAIGTSKFAAGAKAPNADLLDGIDSAGFVRGTGSSTSAVLVLPPNGGAHNGFFSVPGFGRFDVLCGGPSFPLAPPIALTYVNDSGGTIDYTRWVASYYNSGGEVQQSGTNGGELANNSFLEVFLPGVGSGGAGSLYSQVATWQLNPAGGTGLATVQTSELFDNSGNCVFRASALTQS